MKIKINDFVRRGLRFASRQWEPILATAFPRTALRTMSHRIYNYHNLGSGVFPVEEEKTPNGSGERYNFDRMSMMVGRYAFEKKNLLDIGCNSGWFTIQAKWLGAGTTVGIDLVTKGMMGEALKYAIQFERVHKVGVNFVNGDVEKTDLQTLAQQYGIKQFDVTLLLSVFHHIGEEDNALKQKKFREIFDVTKDIIFYEDHEFWNEMLDCDLKPVSVVGEGYRYGWNKDLTWQRKMNSLELHEKKVLEHYFKSWRRETLMLDRFSRVELIGFSEKRRPLLALVK